MEINRNTIARRMERVRRDLKLSQQQLAERLGIGQSTVSKYLQGRRPPTVEALWRLARLSGRSMEWFLGGGRAPVVAEPRLSYGDGSWDERLNALSPATREAMEHLLNELVRKRASERG